MKITDLLKTLKSQNAFIVHCARSGRGGELNAKPHYPNDLKDTIRDLKVGDVRFVSCSVAWPAHQHTFGEIGIIVKPRDVSEIIRLSTGDGGTLDDGQGGGDPLSASTVAQTFSNSKGHNEWLLKGGEVVGIFLNFAMGLRVARMSDAPPGMDIEDAKALCIEPDTYPVEISVAEIAEEFPGLPLFGFRDGLLQEFNSNGDPVGARHPY